MKFIDSQKEHNQILYELGILDDEEDWPLFQQMQREHLDDLDIDDLDLWWKYMVIPGSK
jgi:hypothetical protein